MVDDQPSERPAHRRTRELGARIGRLTHILTPHVSTPLTPVAAHAHVQNRGTPPAGLVRQAPDHRVTSHALAPAASTPPILTNNAARQHCTVWLNAQARHFQAQVIQARERAQIRAIKDSIGHVEVFQMDGVGISIIERPRPLPGHDTPNPTQHPYTLKCEEPHHKPAIRMRQSPENGRRMTQEASLSRSKPANLDNMVEVSYNRSQEFATSKEMR